MIDVDWGNSTQIAINRIGNIEICGNCTKWMTQKCPREKTTMKPSASGFVCDKFQYKAR